MSDAWDPVLYQQFEAQRGQPFGDLVAMIEPRPGMRVVDLGCGSGSLTLELHRRLEAAVTLGIDSSAEMLGPAREIREPGLAFRHADIEQFGPEERVDLVFSNAALQWLGDHPAVFGRLAEMIGPGGQLAVQMPANDDHVTHVVARELAREPQFAGPLNGFVGRDPILPADEYAVLLHELGFAKQQVVVRVYPHMLPGPSSLLEWVSGTLLTSYRRRLNESEYARFSRMYRERLLERVTDPRPYFYPFKRLLLWARRV